jgi:hypothetical protein
VTRADLIRYAITFAAIGVILLLRLRRRPAYRQSPRDLSARAGSCGKYGVH